MINFYSSFYDQDFQKDAAAEELMQTFDIYKKGGKDAGVTLDKLISFYSALFDCKDLRKKLEEIYNENN